MVAQLTSPFVMVIFGATGDLIQRKLLPALFHLYRKDILPEEFFIVGFSRRPYGVEDFNKFLKDSLIKHDAKYEFNEPLWQQFSRHLHYQQGDFDVVDGYNRLIEKLAVFDKKLQACVPRYFYLATPPDKYTAILDFLHDTKLSEGCGHGSDKWTKVMVEKPFGRDLADAQKLDVKLAQIFKEAQIYRIDHYLGKETVQNILAFRYGNTIFDPLWNRQFIDHVQITIAESLGVETRGNFYEGVGALRDMAQSHLLELMTAIAMKPVRYNVETLRDSRAKVVNSIVPIKPEEVSQFVVRGQYGSNVILERSPALLDEAIGSQTGFYRPSASRMTKRLNGYRQEPNVNPNSNTETYVAVKVLLDDSRWQGVPFYLRTGKRLKRKATEIAIVFKEPRLNLFGAHFTGKTNILRFKIEPDEGITLSVLAKKVGLVSEFELKPMTFTYEKEKELPQAYERLLLDVMKGDQALFTRTDEVAASWKFIADIIKGWQLQGNPVFPNYTAGSWGPEETNKLIGKDGREWLLK